MDSQVHFFMVSQLKFCTNLEIPHFFSDGTEILKLACTDITIINIAIFLVNIIAGFLPALGIFYSYYKIISSIVRVLSSLQKYKDFSTCGFHLSVVCLFYQTGIGVYLSTYISSSSKECVVALVIYTMVVPMMNPFIYILRNRDIKNNLQKIFTQIK
jgi:olfactory receptor